MDVDVVVIVAKERSENGCQRAEGAVVVVDDINFLSLVKVAMILPNKNFISLIFLPLSEELG